LDLEAILRHSPFYICVVSWAIWCLACYELKQHKAWFDGECWELFEQRKQANL